MTRIQGIAYDEPLDIIVKFHNFCWNEDDINRISNGIFDAKAVSDAWVIPGDSNTLESVITAIINDFDTQNLIVSTGYNNGKAHWIIDYDYNFVEQY